MKKLHIFLIVGVIFFLFLTCGKSNETAQVEQNYDVQTTAGQNPEAKIVGTATNPGSSRDKNGWYHDWDEGMAVASKENKLIIVDFYADWCNWCKVMDEKTFSDSEIKDIFAKDWITIRLNTEDNKTTGSFTGNTLVFLEKRIGSIDKLNKALGTNFTSFSEARPTYNQLAGIFGIKGLPSYLFIDKKGEPITVISSFYPKEKFKPILNYFKNEIYKKNIDLYDYIESNS